jgi:hypothetical protein
VRSGPPPIDKGLETVSEIQLTDYRDKNGARIRATPGLFALNEEISVLIRLCGGGGEDSNSMTVALDHIPQPWKCLVTNVY